MSKIKIIVKYQDIRRNNEEFVITPYLHAVYSKNFFYGLGVCWGFWSCGVAFAFNTPDGYKKIANLYEDEDVKVNDYINRKRK